MSVLRFATMEQIVKLEAENERLRAENKSMRDVLQWYAEAGFKHARLALEGKP